MWNQRRKQLVGILYSFKWSSTLKRRRLIIFAKTERESVILTYQADFANESIEVFINYVRHDHLAAEELLISRQGGNHNFREIQREI